jgi:protein MpaA
MLALLAAAITLGHSVQGRPIRVVARDGPKPGRTVLVVGCIHGNECAGEAVTRRLASGPPPARGRLLIVPDLNPDGHARGTRGNAHGVDLNRNFPSQWRRLRGAEYSGPRPLSEPETRVARALIRREHPDVTLWFHQPQAVVRAWGHSIPEARRFARAAGVRYRSIRWPAGTAPNWQNHTYRRAAAFVVELPAGPLSAAAARRYARAVLRETGPPPARAAAR